MICLKEVSLGLLLAGVPNCHKSEAGEDSPRQCKYQAQVHTSSSHDSDRDLVQCNAALMKLMMLFYIQTYKYMYMYTPRAICPAACTLRTEKIAPLTYVREAAQDG